MTIREAIDEMKFGIDENESTGFYNVQTEAYKKAIEALEKQIPKKPKIELLPSKSVIRCYCPNCGEYFGDTAKLFYARMACGCGQKLDWSEE